MHKAHLKGYNDFMKNTFKILAENLDKLPNRFPATESGVELELLAELFTEKEAEIAGFLNEVSQVAKEISEKTEETEREVFVILKGMVRKGLIEIEKIDKGLGFKLIPFVVGFYENQNAKISKKFAQLFEQYYKEAFGKMNNLTPSLHRVIPVNKTVPVNIDILQYENVNEYLKGAKSFGVLDCICRVQKRHIGQGCDHSINNCLVFYNKENAFKNSDTITTLTREAFIEKMHDASLEGLVPSTSNKQDGITYICNCCTCSCGLLRAISEFGATNSVAKSSYIIQAEMELCTGCGLCIKKCQFGALSVKNKKVIIDFEKCYGCGVCTVSCPSQTLSLRKKPKAQIQNTPINQKEWNQSRRR